MTEKATEKKDDEVRNKTVQVDPETYEKIVQIADAAERTVSKQTNRILRKALEAEIDGN